MAMRNRILTGLGSMGALMQYGEAPYWVQTEWDAYARIVEREVTTTDKEPHELRQMASDLEGWAETLCREAEQLEEGVGV